MTMQKYTLEDRPEILPLRERQLLRMAADAAEQAYRRGFQQGAVAMQLCSGDNGDSDALRKKIADWRFQRRPYRASISAPGLGPPEKGAVLDRFRMETAGRAFYDFLSGLDRP
jgi:hypothetical protein